MPGRRRRIVARLLAVASVGAALAAVNATAGILRGGTPDTGTPRPAIAPVSPATPPVAVLATKKPKPKPKARTRALSRTAAARR